MVFLKILFIAYKKVQNTVACFAINTSHFTQTTPFLKFLLWLPINYLLNFKIYCISYMFFLQVNHILYAHCLLIDQITYSLCFSFCHLLLHCFKKSFSSLIFFSCCTIALEPHIEHLHKPSKSWKASFAAMSLLLISYLE